MLNNCVSITCIYPIEYLKTHACHGKRNELCFADAQRGYMGGNIVRNRWMNGASDRKAALSWKAKWGSWPYLRERGFAFGSVEPSKMASGGAKTDRKLALEIRTKSVEQTLVPLVTQVCLCWMFSNFDDLFRSICRPIKILAPFWRLLCGRSPAETPVSQRLQIECTANCMNGVDK